MSKKDKKHTDDKGEVLIYRAKDGQAKLEVNLRDETVWLTQKQIAELFGIERSVITKHLRNIFKTEELEEKSNVQKMHIANSDKPVSFYNLNMILSVGYRANSKRATQFRIWATKTLHDHLIKGYAINENRLQQRDAKLQELERVIRLFQDARQNKLLDRSETDGLLQVITEYTNSWILLQKYDQEKIAIKKKTAKEKSILDYAKAKDAITQLKNNLLKIKEAAEIFAQERSHGLEAILGNLNQTFDGKALYPSIEQKAAHLLYFVIKDHPFVDGNKRVGSFLFIAYLAQNKYLLNKNGEKKINDNALVALALLVAQSHSKEKELIIALVTNLL